MWARVVERAGGYAPRWWVVAAGAAVVFAALWIREPSIPYLVACGAATAAAAPLVRRLQRRRGAAALHAILLAAFVAVAGVAQRALWQVDHRWPAAAAAVAASAENAFARALDAEAATLRQRAAAALDAPATARGAFAHLAALSSEGEERALVLYRGGEPRAWSGRVRVLPDTLREPLGAAASPFYLSLYAVARRGDATAVATRVVHAEPPADRLARALGARVAARQSTGEFEFAGVSERAPGFRTFAPAGVPLFAVRAAPPVQAEVRLRTLERGRLRGGALLAAALACFVLTAWYHRATLRRRIAALAVALLVVAVLPLSAFSNASALFDPSYYFTPVGGPLTASVAALLLSGAIVLLALLAVLRSPVRYPSRAAALGAVAVVAGVGPFLLRNLAKGITPPSWGVTATLWLAWQVTIFLAAVSVLLAGAAAGRAALGARRGLPPAIAPVLAAVAALLGPVLWQAPGRWPSWYPALWIAAIGALALTRRARGFVLNAAIVAGLGAATLVWSATARKRVELAVRDVAGLSVADASARALLERFATYLAADTVPASRAELLRRFMDSELTAAGYPVALAAWRSDGTPAAVLDLPSVGAAAPPVAALAASARVAGVPAYAELPGSAGVQLVAAVPHPGGQVTTVVVAPRTRLIPDDPFSALLGLAPTAPADPPYTLLPLTELGVARVDSVPRWIRRGSELHGDWRVDAGGQPRRVHVEVELRSLDALVQRGVLVVLLDLLLVAALWTLSALSDGGLRRWLRLRRRGWGRSYRVRLTVALFGFFVVPAAVFGAWSYRRLQSDDRQSRELLVREALRSVRPAEDRGALPSASARLDTPLLLYAGGELAEASDSLYQLLAPAGLFLPPAVHLTLDLGEELTASEVTDVGRVPTLFGYRAAGVPGERLVLAAPARTDEEALDRRRRDLGILVLFSTAAGALAALWLSGIAAREFARPIGSLRRAALAVAAGEREPTLSGEPPLEFQPVFRAFRRMAADLSESQRALEEAQRRTEAVLRNVASGVLAVDREGCVGLANPRAAALLGRELAPGLPLAELGVPQMEERVRRFLHAGADDEEFDAEVDGRQLHGRLVRLSRAGGAVLTLDDLTELARAQRVLAWGEMARQVAHEIKNPLTPIRLGVQHLKRARSDARPDFDRILDQNVGRILAEIDRLDEIARAFSRYGTAPAERAAGEPTDVAAIARDVVELERLGEGAVRWELRGADEPAVARARGEELREVLLNLLENARLADARTVSMEVVRAEGRVRVVVSDDGAGIAADVLPRVFEPHFSTRTSGSGLGLAISRRMVEGWGGAIGLASEPGRGTRVEVALVAADGAAPPEPAPAA